VISMWRQFFGPPLGLTALALAFAFSGCLLAQSGRDSRPPAESLRSFLQNRLRQRGEDVDKTTRYLYAFVDLDGQGKNNVVVYVTGQSWCGSGGCTTLVLAPSASSYRIVTRIPVTRLPIRLLSTRSNGWRDLAVWVQGGGIQRGYESLLPFDGKSYPANPSIAPARPLDVGAIGDVVLPEGEGALLYQ
jgi:hypothetical protein